MSRTWEAGDVVWSRVGKWPYWPSLVVPNTENGVPESTKKIANKYIHVQFCGDNGRHNWTPPSTIIEFEGLDAFKAKADAAVQSSKKLYNIKGKMKKQWDEAVKEAEEIFSLTKSDRLKTFQEKYPISEPKSKKRKQVEGEGDLKKKSKKESLQSSKENAVPSTSKVQDNVSNVSEAKTSNKVEEKELSSKPSPKKVPKKRKTKKKLERDFRLYCSKQFPRMKDAHPDLTDKNINDILREKWATLTTEEKERYDSDTPIPLTFFEQEKEKERKRKRNP